MKRWAVWDLRPEIFWSHLWAVSYTHLDVYKRQIEQRVTDEKGQITFTADLPVDGKYYVKEIFAPDGFVTTEEVQEFTFEYAGEEMCIRDRRYREERTWYSGNKGSNH